jgi:hypothetical protein
VEDASWVNWAANRYNKAKVSAVKLVEYADSLLQAPVDTEALQYIGTHSDDLVQKSQLIIQTKHEFKSMTLNLEILQKKIAQEKDKKKKLTADVDKLDQLQFELSLLKVPSASQPEKPTIEMVVTVDRGKKIGWVEDSGLCENVQRLLEEYLTSDRYRTRDRLKPAKAVIDKISGLAEKSPLERDKALLDFIRLEQPKISSHGFNGKSSRLYGIYQQAEIHMRRRIDAEFAGINELNHENEETKKSLDTSIQSVDRLKLRMDKFKAILQAVASMSGEAEFVGGSFKERANLPDNDQTYRDLQQKNHVVKMKYFESSQDEAIKKKVKDVVVAQGKISQATTEWAAKMSDLQGKMSQAETELEVLKAENAILENDVSIRYLEASKKSRELDQGELFRKRTNHREIDSTLLVMYVERFLTKLKQLWGWGPELPKTQSLSEAQQVSPPIPNPSEEVEEVHEPEQKKPRYK